MERKCFLCGRNGSVDPLRPTSHIRSGKPKEIGKIRACCLFMSRQVSYLRQKCRSSECRNNAIVARIRSEKNICKNTMQLLKNLERSSERIIYEKGT